MSALPWQSIVVKLLLARKIAFEELENPVVALTAVLLLPLISIPCPDVDMPLEPMMELEEPLLSSRPMSVTEGPLEFVTLVPLPLEMRKPVLALEIPLEPIIWVKEGPAMFMPCPLVDIPVEFCIRVLLAFEPIIIPARPAATEKPIEFMKLLFVEDVVA